MRQLVDIQAAGGDVCGYQNADGAVLEGLQGVGARRLALVAVDGCRLDAVAACLPTLRERYLGEFRVAGFEEARITEEKPYPASYILGDAGVKAFLAANEASRAELEAFAGSISGAIFEATKS